MLLRRFSWILTWIHLDSPGFRGSLQILADFKAFRLFFGSILRRRGGSWVLFRAVVAGPGFYSVTSWRVLGSILCRRAGSWVLFCAVVGYVPSSGFPSIFKVFRQILKFSVDF